jgi:hypothetical protein
MLESPVLEKLRRWEDAGGSVRITRRSQHEAVIELRACTGELIEQFSCVADADPTPADDVAAKVGDPARHGFVRCVDQQTAGKIR